MRHYLPVPETLGASTSATSRFGRFSLSTGKPTLAPTPSVILAHDVLREGRMFGKIAKLFKKSAGSRSETPFSPAPPAEQPGTATAVHDFSPPASGPVGDLIAVPFSAILSVLPKELQGRSAASSGSHSYHLPKSVALEQLSRGAVKVPFGELRRCAPLGLLAAGTGSDSRLVDLPLREILNQIRPESFTRRSDQQVLTVPDDLSDLFGSKGERLTTVRVLDKSETRFTKAPAPVPAAEPVPQPPARPEPTRHEPIRVAPSLARQLASAPTIPAPSIPAPSLPRPAAQPTPAARTPAQTPQPTGPSISAVPRPQPAIAPTTTKAPAPASQPKPTLPSAPAPAAQQPLPANAIRLPTAVNPLTPEPARAPAPRPAAVPTPFPGATGATISVSLAQVCQKWPEHVRGQIQQLGATDVELPTNVIETALKMGKVEFPLRQVVIWLRPEPEVEVSLEHAETLLEFPLNVIAPLFLQQRTTRAAKKSNVPKGIPDLFNAKGETADPEEAEEIEAAAETEPVAPEPPPAPVPAMFPERKRPQNLAELFNEPNKKNWTPNEIVHKTITLPGVTGALIALQDGLLVAGCMPPPWKTETIAAFIPQIFGRLTQYTKELQMGEVTSVSFAVGSGTLQIFNAGIIYFAALGNPDSALPVPDLCLISTELGRHTR